MWGSYHCQGSPEHKPFRTKAWAGVGGPGKCGWWRLWVKSTEVLSFWKNVFKLSPPPTIKWLFHRQPKKSSQKVSAKQTQEWRCLGCKGKCIEEHGWTEGPESWLQLLQRLQSTDSTPPPAGGGQVSSARPSASTFVYAYGWVSKITHRFLSKRQVPHLEIHFQSPHSFQVY